MYCSWGALAVALVPFAAALSPTDISSVLGSGDDLTGQTTTLPAFDLSVFANKTHALFSINATTTPPATVGWFGVGPGLGMVDADLLVMWPTFITAAATDPMTSWVLSHRNAPGHVMPSPASADPKLDTANFFTLVPALTTTDPGSAFTSVSFVRLLAMPSNYPSTSPHKDITPASTSICYASSSNRPATNTEDATITQHNQAHSPMLMDLSVKANAAPGASPTAAGSATGTADGGAASASTSAKPGFSRRDKFLAAHAAIASIALLFFSPLAILTARYLRRLPWFKIHASVQFSAYFLVVIAFSIALANVKDGQHFQNSHAYLGVAIFLLLNIQMGIGVAAHQSPRYKNASTLQNPADPTVFEAVTGKPWIRLGHITLGLIVTILGWAQIRLGLEIWVEYSDSGRQVPMVIIILFWALIVVESAEVFLGRFLKEETRHDLKASSIAGTQRGASVPLSRGPTGEDPNLPARSASAIGRAMDMLKWKRPELEQRSSDDITVVGDEDASGSKGEKVKKEDAGDMARVRTI
ncbi:hypothetical protein P7C70_g7780, partial [Phenoliferia sp. Uapishka_3]